MSDPGRHALLLFIAVFAGGAGLFAPMWIFRKDAPIPPDPVSGRENARILLAIRLSSAKQSMIFMVVLVLIAGMLAAFW
jgi:hypothetical protein